MGIVLQYYRRCIQRTACVDGRVDRDTENYITQTLLTAIFKFHSGRQPYRLQLSNRRFASNQKAINLFNRFAVSFCSCLAFLEIPGMKKQRGKLLPQLAESPIYPWRVSKKKISPLSAFFGLRGVVGNKRRFQKSPSTLLCMVLQVAKGEFLRYAGVAGSKAPLKRLASGKYGNRGTLEFLRIRSYRSIKIRLLSILSLRESCWGAPSPNPVYAVYAAGKSLKIIFWIFQKQFRSASCFSPINERVSRIVEEGFTTRKRYDMPHRGRVVETHMIKGEYAEFMERSSAYSMSQTELIRQAIAGVVIRPIIAVSPVSNESLAAVGKLITRYSRISGDLSQIARTLSR